jgi:ATP/maltotriose-dependent transcriptional regulator MalT
VDALRAGFGRQDAPRRGPLPDAPHGARGARPAAETEPPGGPALPPEEPLSEREREVLRLLDAGASNRDLARELVIATGTAKQHVHSILSKLRVRSRLQAVARARLIGLL